MHDVIPPKESPRPERQVTDAPYGHILTNCQVWSRDSCWIVFDNRSDADGTVFDGVSIQAVNIETGTVRTIYTAKHGACCGVATFHPKQDRVAFILGPEHPTPDWQYGPAHRQGVFVDMAMPEVATNLDARDLTPPFTPGALRGGSHVHVFSPDGEWVSFTYNDHMLPLVSTAVVPGDIDQRNIGISVPAADGVRVSREHPRNHDGAYFTVLVTRTETYPAPGSDAIQRAFEEGWIGSNGYRKTDGSWQKRALAFQGEVVTSSGAAIAEVFVADLPDDIRQPGEGEPLEGTLTRRPLPPRGTIQRRITFTQEATYPGIKGPRHWLRSAPDGSRIAFLHRNEAGVVQLYTVSPNGGEICQVTCDPWGIASAFTWSPEGKHIAYVADNSVFMVEVATGKSQRLTKRSSDEDAPLCLACVYSPNGRYIAYLRRVPDTTGVRNNQIFVVAVWQRSMTDFDGM